MWQAVQVSPAGSGGAGVRARGRRRRAPHRRTLFLDLAALCQRVPAHGHALSRPNGRDPGDRGARQ